jgi:hypothetical protein
MSGGGGAAGSSTGGIGGSSGGSAGAGAGGATCADVDAPWVFDGFGKQGTYFLPGFQRRRVWGSSPSDLWVVGPGELEAWHFDGTSWTAPGSFVTDAGFVPYEIRGSSLGTVLVLAADGRGSLFDGSTWKPFGNSLPMAPSLSFDSAFSVMISGANAVVVHEGLGGGAQDLFGGTAWNAYGVSARATNDVFVVGGGGFALHDGAMPWAQSTPPQSFFGDWYDVAHIADGVAFAVGGSFADGGGGTGMIVRLSDSGQLMEPIPPEGVAFALVGVWAASESFALAVNGASMLAYDGQTWAARKLPGQGASWADVHAAESIWGIDPRHVVVAAVDGAWRCDIGP